MKSLVENALELCLPLRELLRSDGFVKHSNATFTPLTGGISSNVLLVDDDGHRFVAKQALPQLKVKDTWYADVSRNRYERDYLECVSRLCPDYVPNILGGGEGYFVMEYLGEGFSTWKELLLRGDFGTQAASTASQALARIHHLTSGNKDLESRFDTTANFHQLRTDPYLLTTGARHPSLRDHFEAEAERLENTRECLVHGDYSPKNLLFGHGRMAIVDCEVAWYGDPAFDLAFLITHLLLKALYRWPSRLALRSLTELAMSSYFLERGLSDSSAVELDFRVARLLLMLLLARVDGKSPVEYLDEAQRQFIRDFVGTVLPVCSFSMSEVIEEWFSALETTGVGGLN